jgi:Tol biopolymer transport system component
MPIPIGAQIGVYEITSLLGVGGMGEVYRARDTRLQRDVALKFLPDAVAADVDRLARFQREAQILASLNHPNIAQIFGIEEGKGTGVHTRPPCIVMEMVSGETLQARLRRGPIPVTQALPLVAQIATALEAAHERGIVHRDLKPANIKVLPNGTVKVLDFGLAKTNDGGVASDLSNSPTMVSMAGTDKGIILGTAPYMSPEQARGESVDHRTDIFAFGCVLYEMLTGKQAFDGRTVSDVLASVLAREPDAAHLPSALPLRIRNLLSRCLAKDIHQRWQAIGDVRYELEHAADEPPQIPASTTAVHAGGRSAWIIAAAAILALAAVAWTHFREKPLDEPEMRLEIATPATSAPLDFALSPDGRYIAFIASGGGAQRLWLRPLDKTEAQPLGETEGAANPFWSPDSRTIAFYAGGKLKRIDIVGGSPQVLGSSSAIFGGAWNAQGTIIYTAVSGPLSRISASGGDPVQVTHTDIPRQVQHRYPQFLPDGQHFLYYVVGTPEAIGIYWGSLDGKENKRLAPAETAGAFLPPDMIVFGRGASMMVQHIDLKLGVLTGEPVRLGNFSGSAGVNGQAGLSISLDGRIAYRAGSDATRRLKWFDRAGKETGSAGDPDSTQLLYPELSPDGRQVAMDRSPQGNSDIWLMDVLRGGLTRLTFEPSIELSPVWSPDGKRVAYATTRTGPYNIYAKPSSGAGAEEMLTQGTANKYTQDWSRDGRFLLYFEINPTKARDLWALPLTGNDRKPVPIATSTFDKYNGRFSPDGRWVAYQTNESGEFQIVVQSFPEPTGKWQVSTGGGTQPRWRPDGKELYFVAPDEKMMAAPVTSSAATFAYGTPVALFRTSMVSGQGVNRQEYDVSPDGRFLINQPAESTTTPITLILNWRPPKP